MSSVVVYGIPNCDTMKKARAWFAERDVEYVFHDYKKQGIARERVAAWCAALGWETVMNRAGTTFRKLPAEEREALTESRAIELMIAQPSLIKRPLLEAGGRVYAGFKPERYAEVFGR